MNPTTPVSTVAFLCRKRKIFSLKLPKAYNAQCILLLPKVKKGMRSEPTNKVILLHQQPWERLENHTVMDNVANSGAAFNSPLLAAYLFGGNAEGKMSLNDYPCCHNNSGR